MTLEFRARLKRGEKLLGTMVTLASAASAEVLASLRGRRRPSGAS